MDVTGAVSNPYADPGHAAMLRYVLTPPRHRAELLRVRRELARLIPILTEWPYDLSRQVDDLRARERELSHEDSLPRLLYAEWLDEHAESAECPACLGGSGMRPTRTRPVVYVEECPRCRGAGRVCEGAERAEFIRVQIELARYYVRRHNGVKHYHDAPDMESRLRRVAELEGRERELYGDPDTGLGRRLMNELPPPINEQGWSGGLRDCIRRGFVEQIACTSADWLAHADAITAVTPIRTVRLTTWPEWTAPDRPRLTQDLLAREWPLIEFELPVVDRPHRTAGTDVMPGRPNPALHRQPGPRPIRYGL